MCKGMAKGTSRAEATLYNKKKLYTRLGALNFLLIHLSPFIVPVAAWDYNSQASDYFTVICSFVVFLLSVNQWCVPTRRMPKTKQKKRQPNPYNTNEPSIKQLTGICADEDAEDNYKCSQCSKSAEQLLECESCEQWFCCTCQNVCDKLFIVLCEYKSLHWFCAKCEPNLLRCSKDATPSQVNQQGQRCELEHHLTALQSQLTSLTASLSKITNTCNTVNSSQASTVASSTTFSGVLALRAVDEYRQRERCKLNHMFHKVSESTHSEASSRQKLTSHLSTTLPKNWELKTWK